jgi:hypothetical protein
MTMQAEDEAICLSSALFASIHSLAFDKMASESQCQNFVIASNLIIPTQYLVSVGFSVKMNETSLPGHQPFQIEWARLSFLIHLGISRILPK